MRQEIHYAKLWGCIIHLYRVIIEWWFDFRQIVLELSRG